MSLKQKSQTPETDAAIVMAYASEEMVPPEVAKRLEVERNAAREDAEKAKKSLETLLRAIEKRFGEV
jgi:hypothetical protein